MSNVARIARLSGAALALVCTLALSAGGQTERPTVMKLTLNGVVDPFTANYVTSGIRAANDRRAAAVLLTIDTPGGLDSSMRQIIQAELSSRVPVVCYVSPQGARAASAGAFILIACPVAAMAPGTNVGAAHPVGVSGAIMSKKVENDAAAYIRSLAERQGRNADWAEQAVRESVSISAQEAFDMNVIDLIAPSERALLDQVDGSSVQVAGGETVTLHTAGATIEPRGMGLGASLLHSLLSPDLAFIFFYLGIGLIVIEFLHPGVSVPGILGALFLVAAFVSFGMLPVQLVGVALLLSSAVFFLLELKHPGLGVATVGGVVTLILGGLTLFNPSVPNARVSPWVILPVAGFLVLFFGTVVKAALRARHLPPAAGSDALIGKEGVVTRRLAPDGVIQLASETWSAHSTAGPLSKGARVRVVGVDRLRLDVEPIEEPIEERAPAVPGQGEGRTS